MWPGVRLTKIQTTSRPDHMSLAAWTRIGKAAQRREKTRMGKREIETRTRQRFEGICSIDPSDEECKDIIKSAKAAAMPCKRAFPQACMRETVVSKT